MLSTHDEFSPKVKLHNLVVVLLFTLLEGVLNIFGIREVNI